VPPKVKSWRDAGDTHYRKNHREEAKLWLLHTPSPRIASPLHVKQRNQKGSCAATRCQCPEGLGRHRPQGEPYKWNVVLPQKTLGQISIAPWTDRPPSRKKRETE
jgi:hypothetical protein